MCFMSLSVFQWARIKLSWGHEGPVCVGGVWIMRNRPFPWIPAPLPTTRTPRTSTPPPSFHFFSPLLLTPGIFFSIFPSLKAFVFSALPLKWNTCPPHPVLCILSFYLPSPFFILHTHLWITSHMSLASSHIGPSVCILSSLPPCCNSLLRSQTQN